ncbi:hypothetical protein [Paenibacillus sp. FSL L8-0158]
MARMKVIVTRAVAIACAMAGHRVPTAWLSEYVLGIRPVKPGCRTISVKP